MRTWADGDSCDQCPNLPNRPHACVSDEPQLWRTAEVHEGNECSVLLVNECHEFFTGWSLLEMNQLPEDGGWTEQPNYWIEAFDIIGPEVRRYQLDKMKEARNQSE